MNPSRSHRGQPLIALLLILGGWVAIRLLVRDAGTLYGSAVARTEFAIAAGTAGATVPSASAGAGHSAAGKIARPGMFARPGRPTEPAPPPLAPSGSMSPLLLADSSRALAQAPLAGAEPARTPPAVSPQVLAAAALPSPIPSSMPPPSSPSAPPPQGAASAFFPSAPDPAQRWSADGWLLLRRGGKAAPLAGIAPATYGASQAGAVLRYRFLPDSARRPAAYLRASAALDGSREREAALGLSARPIAWLPLVAAAEVRINSQPGAERVRPAAFLYTELPSFALPLAARGEFYGQAGYVGGNFASAFADGQLRVDRQVLRLGRGDLRAGGGAWGGAQKGAARFDVGPTATVGMPIGGNATVRLGLDWRFRLAGNAAPASGPALTLSAGF